MSERNTSLTPEDLARLKSAAEFIESLPENTRDWLLGLRDEDVATAKRGMDLIKSLEATGRVLKWVIITFAAAVIGAAAFGEAVSKVLAWFRVPK